MVYDMDNPESLEEWEILLKPFYPSDFGTACMAFRNQLPYGLPDWLIESTVASFFSMFANEEAMMLFKQLSKEAKNDPFKLGTVEEFNVRTGELGKAGMMMIPAFLRLDRDN